MRRAATFLLTAISCIASVGCSSDANNGAASAPVCNTLVDDGPTITAVALAESAPAPTGGTLADGTYQLASATLYTGQGGQVATNSQKLSAVFEISGNVMQQVGSVNGALQRYTSNYSISATTISTVDTCPAPDSGSYQFSASPAGFQIYSTDSHGTFEQAYSKR